MRKIFVLAALAILTACDSGGGSATTDTDTTDEVIEVETVSEFLEGKDYLTFDTDHFEAGNTLHLVYESVISAIVTDEDADSGLAIVSVEFVEWDELIPAQDLVYSYTETVTDEDTGEETDQTSYCAGTYNLWKQKPYRESAMTAEQVTDDNSQSIYYVSFNETTQYLLLTTDASRGFVATAWDDVTQTYSLCRLFTNDEGQIECDDETPYYLTLDRAEATNLAKQLDAEDPASNGIGAAELDDAFFTDAGLQAFNETHFLGQSVVDVLPINEYFGWTVSTSTLNFGETRSVFGDSTAQFEFANDGKTLMLDYVNGSRWYVFTYGEDSDTNSYQTCWLSSLQIAAGHTCASEHDGLSYLVLDDADVDTVVAEVESRLTIYEEESDFPDSTDGLIQCSELSEDTDTDTVDSTDDTTTT